MSYTLIDLEALRNAGPLQAAQELTGLSTAELWSVVAMLKLKAKKKSTKDELVNLVLAETHPPARPAARPAAAQQLGLFS